jgi:hypothetical protein
MKPITANKPCHAQRHLGVSLCFSTLYFALAALLLCAPSAQAQEAGKDAKSYTYAPDSPTYWRKNHQVGGPGESFVFRRDNSVWVYTPELASLGGLPLEWASAELKGAEAVAFRMAPTGEEDCGFGGQLQICKPVVQCTLDIYFDREKHILPWAPNRMVADFHWIYESSASHLLPGIGFMPSPSGNVSRGNKNSPSQSSLNKSPFSDPQTGEELFWAVLGAPLGGGGLQIMAYDREIHSRLSLVRLLTTCHRVASERKSTVFSLYSRDPITVIPKKRFNEIHLPADWYQRTVAHVQTEVSNSSKFFQQTLQQINQGASK